MSVEIKRLTNEAGVKLNNFAINNIKKNIYYEIKLSIQYAIIICEYRRLKTITVKHIFPSLKYTIYSNNISLLLDALPFEKLVHEIIKKTYNENIPLIYWIDKIKISKDAMLLLQQ